MSIWIVYENYGPNYNGEHFTGEIVLEKAFLTKEAAQEWIYKQANWWKYDAYELPVQE